MSDRLRPVPSEFLRAWFAGCPHDQLIELRAIRPADHHVYQEFFPLGMTDDLVGRAFSLVENYDCYFGVCPRIRSEGSKASVTHAPGLWCDLDFKRFEDAEVGALRRLATFTVQPTWMVATGGGYHAYWKLHETVAADAAFERRLRGLVRALNADPAATDRSRVLRVPGTFNHKYSDCQVRIVSWPTSN